MKTSIEYRDPLELSEELAKLGQLTKITQLEGGSGFYTMQAASAIKLPSRKYLQTKHYYTMVGAMV